MEKTISQLMKKEHEKINDLLEKFENSPEINIFSKFKWTLEKHFFIEEKVIFSVYQSCNEECEEMFDLLKQHKDILFLIDKIEDNLKNSKSDIEDLKNLLKAHAIFEDRVFYPKLDDELSEDQKKLILERSEEIIRD